MATTRWRRVAEVAGVVLGLMLATACGSGDATADTASPTDASEEPAQRTQSVEGVEVTMARAPWASEYLPAEILRQILIRLGYDVESPGLNELDPDAAYRGIGDGSIDFWANSWYPTHFVWLDQELDDGSTVGDNVTMMGGGVRGAGIQGFLATRSWVEDNGVTSMDQINSSPDLVAQLDEYDAHPGNGVWDVPGCPVTWTCDNIIDSQFAFHGWDNFDQVTDPDPATDALAQADYDAMFDGFLELVNDGKPAAIYTWIPSGYVTRAVPGDNAKWLTMHPDDVIDDSNPLDMDGGENFDQRPGFTALGDASCTQPCQLGFASSDLVVTANAEFLAANPMLEAFLPLVSPDAFELQLLVVEQFNGDGSEAHVEELAVRWVEENGERIDNWWAEAQLAEG